MAVDEDMAIDFYKVGDPVGLANKLVAILQSKERQKRMAEHNFSAAMQMTMSTVVRNYLRWFELKKRKKAIGSAPLFPDSRASWRRFAFPRLGASSAGQTSNSDSLAEDGENKNSREGLVSAGNRSQDGWRRSETTTDQTEGNQGQSHQLADDF
jgi:hypothetical protein